MKKISLLLIISFLLFIACNTVYQKNQELPNLKWDKTQSIAFDVEIPEAKIYGISINLRHTSHIQYGDIAVKLAIASAEQSGKVIEKEIVVPIRDKQTGHLLGEAMGDICDTSYTVQIPFENKGKYTLTLQQTNEDEALTAMMEVGITITK
ncbi:MAG: gliding motility lipoprotein GldH [Thermoflexibacter sp.]|jgi:gliding motility-associated lipoprotein GldH|nr:gliding motility lipoprotein GldH [Thermoflexibacter sp.]